MPIASLPIEFIRKQVVMSAANTATSDEITLPTSLRANGGYAVFLYAWEFELESVIDMIADGDKIEIAICKTDPSNTMKNLNDSEVICKYSLETHIVGAVVSMKDTPLTHLQTFIRPIILAGEKIYAVVTSAGLNAAITVNIRLHYQLKWVNAQVFNRSLLSNV